MLQEATQFNPGSAEAWGWALRITLGAPEQAEQAGTSKSSQTRRDEQQLCPCLVDQQRDDAISIWGTG